MTVALLELWFSESEEAANNLGEDGERKKNYSRKAEHMVYSTMMKGLR